MDISIILSAIFVLYFFAFLGLIIGLETRRRRLRNERLPVRFELLRSPGESLRRQVASIDEVLAFHIIGASIVPVIIAVLVLQGIAQFELQISEVFKLGSAGVAFVVGLLASVWWVNRILRKRRNFQLGYLGERAVGESLQSLISEGYRVFHDIPASCNGRTFNLDHVVVGPTGLFLIETKARRKGLARPGYKEHEVTYDGAQLIWPRYEDRSDLQQALREAIWLTKWVETMLGLAIAAKPILALPGWYVKATARGQVNVVNHKGLVSAIKGRGQVELSPEQIDLISRQLDAICRDVTD